MNADDAVRAAWQVLAERGMVAIQWQGLVPTVVVNADLLHIIAAEPADTVTTDAGGET